jgi:hypothetical protein
MVGSEVGTDWAGSNAIAIDRFGQVTGVQAIGGTTSTRAGGTDRFIVDSDWQTPSTWTSLLEWLQLSNKKSNN